MSLIFYHLFAISISIFIFLQVMVIGLSRVQFGLKSYEFDYPDYSGQDEQPSFDLSFIQLILIKLIEFQSKQIHIIVKRPSHKHAQQKRKDRQSSKGPRSLLILYKNLTFLVLCQYMLKFTVGNCVIFFYHFSMSVYATL